MKQGLCLDILVKKMIFKNTINMLNEMMDVKEPEQFLFELEGGLSDLDKAVENKDVERIRTSLAETTLTLFLMADHYEIDLDDALMNLFIDS